MMPSDPSMTFRPLNVLITHECSGNVCREFRALGHSAFSCDLLPRTDGNTEHHLQMDATAAMRKGCPVRVPICGAMVQSWTPWHLVITHRVCRFLANSGSLRLYKGGKKANGIDPDRWSKMLAGAEDFRRQFLIGEYQGPLCAENPVMHCHARDIIDIEGIEEQNGFKVTRQTIQPFQFGDDASKATQLWLRGLPKLVIPPNALWFPARGVCPTCGEVYTAKALMGAYYCMRVTCNYQPLLKRWSNQTDSGQNKLGPSEDRAHIRAITYPGIAKAMSLQWAEYLKE